MKSFIYKWTRDDGYYYIGVHKGDENDGYIGSGIKFRDMYNKNPSRWKRDILYRYDKYEDALEAEKEIVNEDLLNDTLCVNLRIGDKGGSLNHSEETKEKISLSHTGKVMSDEWKQKRSEIMKEQWEDTEYREYMSSIAKKQKGKVFSEEHKKNISKAKRGSKLNLSDEQREILSIRTSGENNPMAGKTHSDEAKRKMSEAAKKRGNNRKKGEYKHSEETKRKLSEAAKNRKRKHTNGKSKQR